MISGNVSCSDYVLPTSRMGGGGGILSKTLQTITTTYPPLLNSPDTESHSPIVSRLPGYMSSRAAMHSFSLTI